MAADILIIGGGYAGLTAALRLGRAARAAGATVTLISPTAELIERIRLHQWAAGQTPPRRFFLPLLKRAGVTFVAGKVTRINKDAHTVDVVAADGGTSTLPFTHCIYAPGTQVDRTMVPGIAEHAFTPDADSVARFLARLQDPQVRRSGDTLVIGGGLSGVELATEIAEHWPDARVHLLCAGRVMAEMSLETRDHVLAVCRLLKVQVTEHVNLTAVHATHVTLADGTAVPGAICMWAAGMCAPTLARDSHLRTDAKGRLIVNETLRCVDDPAILGAGDAVLVSGAGPCASAMGCKVAMPMGAHAADVLRAILHGAEPRRFSLHTLGWCVSLGRRHGVVERMDGGTRPLGDIHTGRVAAFIKEAICRFTWYALVLESWRPGSYAWPRLKVPAQAALPLPRV